MVQELNDVLIADVPNVKFERGFDLKFSDFQLNAPKTLI